MNYYVVMTIAMALVFAVVATIEPRQKASWFRLEWDYMLQSTPRG